MSKSKSNGSEQVGWSIDGDLECVKCAASAEESIESLRDRVPVYPVLKRDLRHSPWMECGCCGCPLELR